MDGRYEIQVVEPMQLQVVAPAVDDFARMWRGAYEGADEWMQRAWSRMFGEWLDMKERKCGSVHTRRNYERVVNAWLDFVSTQVTAEGRILKPWLVEIAHVRAWQEELAQRLSAVTVNHHLSCVSSFYSFVINEKRMVGGVELCLFADASGRARSNPFKYGNVQRSAVKQYERAELMADEDLGRLMRHLREHQHTLTGARNFALVLSYIATGFRNHEVIRMQWKHIRPHRKLKNVMVYSWRGKGGKEDDVPVPASMWNAIVHMLTLDGRWVPGVPAIEQAIDPDEYIWKPLRTHMVGNLTWNEGSWDGEGHLSDKSALRIFRTALKNAGVKSPEKYRVHDLRHAHAVLMLEDGASETDVMLKLHHSNLATTGIYTKSIRKKREDRVDDRSDRLVQKMMEF